MHAEPVSVSLCILLHVFVSLCLPLSLRYDLDFISGEGIVQRAGEYNVGALQMHKRDISTCT